MKRRVAMKSAAPRARSGRSGGRCPRSGGSSSGSVTSAYPNREQQRRLESCEPTVDNSRNKKKTNTGHRPPPKFLKGLARAVTDRSDVIAFKDGSVTVMNHRILVSEVLPVFFKATTTLKSFLRQLNYFAFKKISGKGTKEPGVFHNETLKGKNAVAITSLKRRQTGNPAEESTTDDTLQPPRLPWSSCSSVLARKAPVTRAIAAPVACSSPAQETKLPPPPTTRSAYTSSTLLPPPSMAIGTRSGVAVAPTNPDILGYTINSGPRALAAGKNDCGIAIGNDWNSLDARGDHSTSYVSRKSPVPIATRDGGGTADRKASLDDKGGGGSGPSSDGDLNLGIFAAKRKFGEHFDDDEVTKESLPSKRGCRYLSRYYLKPNGLRTDESQGSGGGGGSGGGYARVAGGGASRQLPGLIKTKIQQRPCAPLAVRAPYGVGSLGRKDSESFAFGYDHGRVGGRATGTSPSSRRSIFYAVLPLDGSAWREQPIIPCPAPTSFTVPSSAGIQPESGLQPEMSTAAVAAAAAAATATATATTGRSPRPDRFLGSVCAKLSFSTGPDQFPAAEKVGNTTSMVTRGTCIDSPIAGVSCGGGEACSGFGGNNMCSFGSEAVFGSFCAVEGDVSQDRLDECFMRERVSSPPDQETLAEPGSGGSEFGVGLFHDYSC